MIGKLRNKEVHDPKSIKRQKYSEISTIDRSKKMKKIAVMLIIGLMGIALLGACQAEPIVETVEVPVEVIKEVEVPVEVEVEVEKEIPTLVLDSEMFAPPAEQEFFINEILVPFMEETGIRVTFQVVKGDDMFDRLTAQQATGHVTTDLILAFNGRFAWYTDEDWTEPLDSFTAEWTDRSILPAFDGTAVVDGTRYFVPISADVYLTIANNDALPYLPEGADMDTLTYEQYADWAIAVAAGEGEGKACITGIPQKMYIYQFSTSALAYGLPPAGNPEPAFPNVNSEGSAAAWAEWARMGAGDAFMPTILNVDNCTDYLMREEAWLSVTHNARVGQVYASNETQFTVGPAPLGSAGIGTIAGAHGLAIVKGSDYVEEAALLLEYLTRPEVQVKMNKGTGGFLPVVAEALDYLGDDPTDEIIRKALIVLENGIPSYLPVADFQDWGAVKKIFDDIFVEMVLEGDGTVDQALLDDGQAQLEALRK
jgi:multiple sugar transport system substrate-binding protein